MVSKKAVVARPPPADSAENFPSLGSLAKKSSFHAIDALATEVIIKPDVAEVAVHDEVSMISEKNDTLPAANAWSKERRQAREQDEKEKEIVRTRKMEEVAQRARDVATANARLGDSPGNFQTEQRCGLLLLLLVLLCSDRIESYHRLHHDDTMMTQTDSHNRKSIT